MAQPEADREQQSVQIRNAARALARTHLEHPAGLHQTTMRVVREFAVIGIEDLNVRGYSA